MSKMSKERISGWVKILDSLDEISENLESGKISAKDAVKSMKQIESNLDEGLPSESGKYTGMSFEQVLKQAMQMENDAIEINLMLLEMSPGKYADKFIEIANDENDHSQIYLSVLNDIKKGR